MTNTSAGKNTGSHASDIAVLLVDADQARRTSLGEALQASGLRVAVVEQLAEIERWPVGQVVVTDYKRFTPWWAEVGATNVVVLADTAEQGIEARQRGAAAWNPHRSSPNALAIVIRNLRMRAVKMS